MRAVHETLRQLTVLRRRASEITLRIRREADLLADVHHELVDLISEIGLIGPAQAHQSSSRPYSTTAASSSPANVDSRPRVELLRINAVAARLGLSRSHVWRMVKEGRFPKPRRLSTRAVAWLESEVSAWIGARPVFDTPHPPTPRPRR
jgi:prophage regulatory protein